MKKSLAVVVLILAIVIIVYMIKSTDPLSTKEIALVSSEKEISLNYDPLYTGENAVRAEANIARYKDDLGKEGNNDYNSYIDIAGQEINMGRGEEVLLNLNQAIKLEPDNILAYQNAGVFFERISAYESAEIAFQKALQIDSSSPSTYALIIDLHKSYLNSESGIIDALFKEALEKTDEDLQLMKDYASWLKHEDRFEESLALWQKILPLEKDPISQELIYAEIEMISDKIKASTLKANE